MPTLDVANDWQTMHGLQDITYKIRVNETTWDNTGMHAMALKREDNKRNAMGRDNASYAIHGVFWEVWNTSFDIPDNIVPKSGDKFSTTTVGGNVEFLVLNVDYSTFTTRYRLHCEQLGQGS